MKKLLLFSTLFILASPVWAASLDRNDDCKEQVDVLVSGIENYYKSMILSTKVLDVKLTSETEVREYSFDIERMGCIDSYILILSNDSASKCLMDDIRIAETCG